MAERRASRTCQACGKGIALSDNLNWYHVGSGLIGWVDDPSGKDAAHKAVPFSEEERKRNERVVSRPVTER